jgi:predicted PurR-regulated permease PerM
MRRVYRLYTAKQTGTADALSRIRPRTAPPFRNVILQGSQLALIGLLGLAVIFVLDFGAAYMVPVTAAILVGMTLGPVVDLLERRGVNSYLASSMVILAVTAIFGMLFAAISGSLEEWIHKVPLMWERATDEVRFLKEPLEGFDEALNRMFDESVPQAENVPEVQITEGGLVAQILSTLPMIGGQIVTFIGVLFFFLATRTDMRTSVLSFCMDTRTRLRTARIFRDIEFFLSRYVGTITAVNIGLGLATGIAMAVLGLPSPVLWGLLAAFLNFVPYLGPAIMAVILCGVGLVVHDTLWAAMLPPAVFLSLNFVEAQFVTPSVIGRALTINPLAVFVALTFWLWLWGPIGALLAVPILIVGLVIVMNVLPRRPEAVRKRRLGPSGKAASAPRDTPSPLEGTGPPAPAPTGIAAQEPYAGGTIRPANG